MIRTGNSIAAALSLAALTLAFGVRAFAEGTPKQVTVQMETTDGRDGGTATLVGEKHGVKIKVDFKNLVPGQHGIHIHEFPKCDAPSFKSAGGHFNPDMKQHGYQNPQGHHAGDIALNLTVGDDGMVKNTFEDKNVTLDPSKPNSVFANGGTSLMVHAGPDDMKSDPAGNAGAREACGIISMSHAEIK
jgi:Cu-Zn family superoxide dismutase